MLSFVERRTSLRFGVGGELRLTYMQAPGARAGGRNVSPRPYPLRWALGPWRHRIRPSLMPYRLTYDEIYRPSPRRRPEASPISLWSPAAGANDTGPPRNGAGSGGRACCSACLRQGAWSARVCAARRLVAREGRVTGRRVSAFAHRANPVTARHGVVLATGGFEWNRDMMDRYHPGPTTLDRKSDTNTGDGHQIGGRRRRAVGAHGPGAHHGHASGPATLARPMRRSAADYTLPHSMVVNPAGRRFVNEVQMNVGLGLDARRSADGRAPQCAGMAYLRRTVTYSRYRHALPKGPELIQAQSLRALAELTGLDAGRAGARSGSE